MSSFKEYMYKLLTTPLRKINTIKNQYYILFQVLGEYFDNDMEMLFKAREQSMIVKADDTFLSEHGKDRKMLRYQSEDLEGFRKRLLMKTEIALQAGSNRSVILTLESLGIENPLVTPTYKYDPKRWAEFDIRIDEDYMDLVPLQVMVREVFNIKQASSLPNWGFTIHSNTGEFLSSEIRCINRISINELGIKSMYLDGSWNLDGALLLAGSSNSIREYKHTVTHSMTIENSNTSTINLTIEKDLWMLDGVNILNGYKKLDAEVIKGDI